MPESHTQGSSDRDRNLLFAVIALQAELLTNDQFAEACAAWTTRQGAPIEELLIERGWITQEDRLDVERILARKLRKHAGDARVSLAHSAQDAVRRALAMLDNSDLARSVADLPPGMGLQQLSTFCSETQVRDRYQLLRLHAQGGIGQVWVARDIEMGREIALKELRPDRSASAALRARFVEEAKVTSQLEHPGIVPIYELKQEVTGQVFYTMRFVRGRTLTDAMDAYHRKREKGEENRFEQTRLLGAFVNVCNAVAYAHSRGVLHRDLKGSNVLLGDFGEVVVVDWGLAKVLGAAGIDSAPMESSPESTPTVQSDQRLPTLAGDLLGTPSYMAPEQAQGRVDLVGRHSDIYALGAMLYEILTGRVPFVAETTTDLLRKVVDEEPTPIRSINRQAPRALVAICRKAMAKKPTERYSSAGELASDVQRYLSDEPVTAFVEPLPLRAGRWARRHRTLVASVAVGLFVAVALLAVSLTVVTALNQQVQETNEKLKKEIGRSAAILAQMSETHAATQMVLNEFVVDEIVPGPSLDPVQVRQRLGQMTRRAYQRFDGQPDALATALNFLANLYGNLSEDSEAEEDEKQWARLLKEALDLRLQQCGPEHPATLQSINNYWLGPYADAEGRRDALKKNLEDCQRVLGPEFSLTRTAHHNWAWILYEDGRFEEAELEWRRLLHRSSANDSHVWMTRNHIAECRADLERPREALALAKEHANESKARYGLDHRRTLWNLRQVAVFACDAGEFGEAVAPLTEILQAQSRADHLLPHHRASVRATLGRALLYLQKPVEAEEHLREAYRIQRERLTRENWRTPYTGMLLGAALARQKKFDEAEAQFLRIWPDVEATFSRIVPSYRRRRLTEVISHVIEMYELRGEKEKAEQWRMKLPG